MPKSVAFIGAGSMGGRMARRVAHAGFDVTICDASEPVRKAFSNDGYRVTARAADTSAADIIIVLVASDAQLDDVLFGSAGVASDIRPERAPVVLVMSTTLPSKVTSIRDRFAPLGVSVIDAPVSGGPVGAEQGTLSILIGGAKADIDRAQPVLNAMGRNLFHCGDVGAGQTVKLVNNMIAISNIMIVGEAYALAETAGVDLARLVPILEVSTGRTFLSADLKTARQQYAAWAKDPATFDSTIHILRKDLHLAQGLADSYGHKLAGLNALAHMANDLDQDAFNRWQVVGSVDSAVR